MAAPAELPERLTSRESKGSKSKQNMTRYRQRSSVNCMLVKEEVDSSET